MSGSLCVWRMIDKLSNKLITASSLLCHSIIEQCGGSAALANSLDKDRQYVHKWMKTGYVPLSQVYEVSQFLEISPWTLSYYKLAIIFGKDSPSFKSIVDKSPLPSSVKANILSDL